MKALVRSFVWWPKMEHRNRKHGSILRGLPKESRVHIDFAGPVTGKYYVIIVDAFSKWLEVEEVPLTAAKPVTKVLERLFATHGIPEVVVSDSGMAFTSQEFAEFLERNVIRQALTVPYHPRSSGQAERMVQETKNKLKKLCQGDTDIKIARFHLHNIPRHQWQQA